MDIIAQLQEHASKIAYIAFNAAGTIQRDAPPSQLFQDYPRPPAVSADALTTVVEQPKEMAAAFVDAVKQVSSSSHNFLSRSLVSIPNVHSFSISKIQVTKVDEPITVTSRRFGLF